MKTFNDVQAAEEETRVEHEKVRIALHDELCNHENNLDCGENVNVGTEEEKKTRMTNLVQAVVTRWNSTYHLIKVSLTGYDAVDQVLNSTPQLRKDYSDALLTTTDISLGEDLVELLAPFQDLIRLMSSSTYVTSSVIIPAVSRFITILAVYESKNNPFIIDVATQMREDLSERAEEAYFKNPLLLAATYMDPRYRSFTFISDANERGLKIFSALQFIKTCYRKKAKSSLSVPVPDSNEADKQPSKKARFEHSSFRLMCDESDDDEEVFGWFFHSVPESPRYENMPFNLGIIGTMLDPPNFFFDEKNKGKFRSLHIFLDKRPRFINWC